MKHIEDKLNVAITGHTRGFGNSMYKIFKSQKHNVLGFSKSNGFDISDNLIREKIINEIKGFDIFINNAYHPQGQIDMLNEILKCWDNTEKIVVNVSSIVVYKHSPYFKEELELYRDSKIKLNNIIKDYKGSVKILNIVPGLMNTDFYLVPDIFDKSNSINTDSLAELLYIVIKNSNNFFIKELIMENNRWNI
jgi:NADP-dependent 3-hydroxy acid dehydrogenase YdfG